jgi:hypothetical protein
MRLSVKSKIGASVSLLLALAGLCLWAIPLCPRETFGIHSRWSDTADYLLASLAAGVLGCGAAVWLIESEFKRAKIMRRVLLALSLLAVVLAGVTLTWLAIISVAMGLS